LAKVIIEPLGSHHDRAAFDCGKPRVTNFIRLTAKKQVAESLAVVRVAVAEGSSKVLGYHSLSAHSLLVDDLPAELTPKSRPYPGLGAFYLGFLGVDLSMQGKGIGRLLLRDAMGQTVLAGEYGGIAFLVLDAIDEAAVPFYRQFGFTALPSQPLRLVLPASVIRQAVAQAGTP
jgi:ribosomal protein S18 acetylase RimI-like enzyme